MIKGVIPINQIKLMNQRERERERERERDIKLDKLVMVRGFYPINFNSLID
jgi:hypothetical protein